MIGNIVVNLAKHYYVLLSVQRSPTDVGFQRHVVPIEDPIDTGTEIKKLRENLAKTFGCPVEAITLWAWWPLGAAAFPAKYKYAVTWLDLEQKTQLRTNVYTIQIPLDSVEGMMAFLNQIPNAAPLFVYPLRAESQEQFSFSRFTETSNN